nr:abscisic acid receptor PYL4-like [Coffea arabica]
MPSNPPKSSLLLHRINTHTTATDTTCKQSQQQQQTPPSPSATAISPCPSQVPDSVVRYHTHAVGPNQCCSTVIQEISAPLSTVWSVARRFDSPQAYKHFVKSCHVIHGDGNVGTLRQVHVISGLPAANSTERLEILDDDRHVISFSVVGGDHRLSNCRSVTTLHHSPRGEGAVAVESYTFR